ncbi:hypothetical protein K0T92_23605 [Paenibacillus oenotherae]|uniref:Uncharacterized protein n=1 Tax=Paenibacillus oenotherae TaxID=1435645 RepID=A0ABS7DCP4_9BACL|nr:hypothetical protein [Paenibacillus oenotherae]MBW7477704.1 hypothetical protein [Paenibacillus oenotherae]
MNEMQQELAAKKRELVVLSLSLLNLSVPEEYIASGKYNMQTMIGLLDAEVPNPQMLNQLAMKFVLKVFIQRETKRLFLTVQLRMRDEILFDKTRVAEL